MWLGHVIRYLWALLHPVTWDNCILTYHSGLLWWSNEVKNQNIRAQNTTYSHIRPWFSCGDNSLVPHLSSPLWHSPHHSFWLHPHRSFTSVFYCFSQSKTNKGETLYCYQVWNNVSLTNKDSLSRKILLTGLFHSYARYPQTYIHTLTADRSVLEMKSILFFLVNPHRGYFFPHWF